MRKTFVVLLFFMLFSLEGQASSELRNTTMDNTFQIHGVIDKESTERVLYVTGNIVFPIANKYSDIKRNRVSETLQWTVEVEHLPIEVSGLIYCAMDITPVTNNQSLEVCKGRRIEITIKQPRITFRNWGIPLKIEAENLSIMPVQK